MSDLQLEFEQLHAAIRLDYDDDEVLRQKRDIILERIHGYLNENDLPTFRPLLQGSYAMRVGIKPPPGQDFDIDVGLIFDFHESEYSAADVRAWVFAAVDGHTETVDVRDPCIRVCYAEDYHVDLVAYSSWEEGSARLFRLAHGKRGWVEADPPALLEYVERVRDRFEGTEDSATKTDQFRRTVRYLKRWNDELLPGDSSEKPSGLALLLLSDKYLPSAVVDDFTGRSRDADALRIVASRAAGEYGRLEAHKPTPEHEDVLASISDSGMDDLKGRFATLASALNQAQRLEPDEAVELLAEQFGDEFASLGGRSSAKVTSTPAILTSHSSA